jgi:TolB-like protein/Tfp pilus assembly protein PilF
MNGFFQRLKERKLVQWTIAYVAAAFGSLQGIDIIASRFGWPDTIERILIIAACIGFFVVLVLAWYHGERGAQRVSRAELLIIGLILALGGGFLWRFVATSHPSDSKTSAIPNETKLTKPAAAIPEKSIAVLPLANESGEKEEQYFSDGLSEDLITALSQFAGLKVIGRNSSFQFRDSKESSQTIGAKLGVAHLLEGSVRRVADVVRIRANLVSTTDGSTRWSQHYDRPYKDLFKVQDDITKAVSNALKTKLLTTPGAVVQSDRPPNADLAAYNAYQQGQFYFQRGSEADLHEALTQFGEATRLDPNYAAAYAAGADTWTVVAGYFLDFADKPRAYAEARSAAETALRLDPDLAAAHLSNGSVLLNADFNWSGAYAEARRALELAPSSAVAVFDLSTRQANSGKVESAVESAKQALARNPLNAFWHDWLASYLGALGRLDEAEAAAKKSVMLAPQQPLSYRELTYIQVLKGNAAAALAAAQKVPPGRNRDVAMAWALQMSPDRAAADAALKDLIAKHGGDSPYQTAEVYALRRDPDNVFNWLNEAWSKRDSGVQYLLYDPIILRYQQDPRFAAFCKSVDLPTTTDAKAMP